jgi:hypothetical protein
MAISGISSYSTAYQQPTVQVPNQRGGAQQAQDVSSAKNITKNPVNAATNNTEITPRRDNDGDDKGSGSLGSTIDVRA